MFCLAFKYCCNLEILTLNTGKSEIYSNSGIVSSEFCLSVTRAVHHANPEI